MVNGYTDWRKASYSNGTGQCVEVASWRKASYSNGQGSCVETASIAGIVAVRDTTDRDGGTLAFGAEAWSAFVAGLK
jgi:Domain of unknown function (DUF397)